MLEQFKSHTYGFALILCIIAYPFAPFLLSIGTALFVLDFFINSKSYRPFQKNPLFIVIAIFILLSALQLIPQPHLKLDKIFLRLGIIAFIIAAHKKIAISKLNRLAWVLIGYTTLISLLSVINYFFHFNELNQQLLEAKAIPIIGQKIQHIYFGIISGLCLIIGIFNLFYYRVQVYYNPKLIAIFILFICFHILSSRTGLVGFYLSILSGMSLYFIRQKQGKKLILLYALFILIPVLAGFFVPSFQNKLKNSYEDLEALRTQEEINYKSLTQRVEFWKTSIFLIKNKPILGYGTNQVVPNMMIAYEKTKSPLYKENRAEPHQQFLYSWIELGILGFICIAFYLLYPLIKFSRYPLNIALNLFFLVACLLESALERQVGIFASALIIQLFNQNKYDQRKTTHDK